VDTSGKSARLTHYRIDETHSNAYTAWQAMGRPQDPTSEQLALLKRRQGLEAGPEVHVGRAADRELHLSLSLPLHALSLLEIAACRPA
jgi:xylan 1,4-beta-xylosidase